MNLRDLKESFREFNGQSISYEEDSILLSKICTVSGDTYCVRVDSVDYETWRHGELIQNVFPQLSADEREFIITGYTPSEWANIFGESE